LEIRELVRDDDKEIFEEEKVSENRKENDLSEPLLKK